MSDNKAEIMAAGTFAVTSLGMSCRSGAALSAGIPAFTPHTLAAKLGAAGMGCLGGMLSTVASAALFAREATPAEITFNPNDAEEIDISAIHNLPLNNNIVQASAHIE